MYSLDIAHIVSSYKFILFFVTSFLVPPHSRWFYVVPSRCSKSKYFLIRNTRSKLCFPLHHLTEKFKVFYFKSVRFNRTATIPSTFINKNHSLSYPRVTSFFTYIARNRNLIQQHFSQHYMTIKQLRR